MGKNIQTELEAAGWVRQFSASGPRLVEAIENYEMLDLEVKTVAMKDLNPIGCSECFNDPNDTTMMIFTRKKSE